MFYHNFFCSQIDNETNWNTIKPEVFATIMDFFSSGLPVVNEVKTSDETSSKSFQLSFQIWQIYQLTFRIMKSNL